MSEDCSEDFVLHRIVSKDTFFFKAVIKISESQRGMNESAKKEIKLSYLQFELY